MKRRTITAESLRVLVSPEVYSDLRALQRDAGERWRAVVASMNMGRVPDGFGAYVASVRILRNTIPGPLPEIQ